MKLPTTETCGLPAIFLTNLITGEQENKYNNMMKNYKIKKATYNAFCEEKLAQIPVVKHPTAREVIQQIKKNRLG
jgi:hypothetical protein